MIPLQMARVVLGGIILSAAWPFGLVRMAEQGVYFQIVAICGGLAVSGWLLQWRKPAVPGNQLLLVGALLLYGWATLLAPRGEWDAGLGLMIPLVRKMPGWLPGTMDPAATWQKMLLVSSYVIIFVVAADAAAGRGWRTLLSGAIALAAGSVAAYALYQKVAGAPNIYWRPGPPANPSFFGPFYYHGNSASYFLTGLPFALGLTALALRRQDNGARKLLWSVVSLTVLTGLLVNTSRAGVWFSIGVTTLMLIRESSRLWTWSGARFGAGIFLSVAAAVAGVCLLGMAFGWEKALQRSTVESLMSGFQERSIAPRNALPAAWDAGWTGFGPGTFRYVFAEYNTGFEQGETRKVWDSLHNDPIQTVIEWGWLGASGWMVLLMLVARQGSRRTASAAPGSGTRAVLEAAGISFLVVFLHSMVDYPFQVPAVVIMTSVAAGLLASGSGKAEKGPSPDQVHSSSIG